MRLSESSLPVFSRPMLGKLLLLSGLFAITCDLHGATLINDPFTDGSRSNATGGDTLGAVWYQGVSAPGAVTIVDDSAGIAWETRCNSCRRSILTR